MNNKFVVNFFAGPGAGKSTAATGLFSELKSRRYKKCEFIPEYAKQLVYEERNDILTDYPDLIVATQRKRINDALKVVDVVITDTSLIFSTVYYDIKSDNLIRYIHEIYQSYNNINVFVKRRTDLEFEQYGRVHEENESLLYDEIMEDLVSAYNYPVIYYYPEREDIAKLADKVIDVIENYSVNNN